MPELTIDELARRVGMTVRNVRAHQTRGLLPAPELRGRTAYYGGEHEQRLDTIRSLQESGLSLDAIGELLGRMPTGRAEQLLALAGATANPFGPEAPIITEPAELIDLWGEQVTPELLQRIVDFGHVRVLPDGRWEVRSPRLYQAATELANLGVPLAEVVELTESIYAHSTSIAADFLRIFQEHIETADPSADREEAIERVSSLAGQSVLAIFRIAAQQVVAEAYQLDLD
ncbi:MerR family transcriptional regulator [Nocardia sp. NPDC051756]|uniref:MerR family transcriptional regulator n=1 Tax=Nocardia sp. NPDC051756 TaxID=3154751 RepID=UPI003448C8CC